jgi:hypothetical protein
MTTSNYGTNNCVPHYNASQVANTALYEELILMPSPYGSNETGPYSIGRNMLAVSS